MKFFPKKHEYYEEFWIVASFHCDGTREYMAFDGCGAFGDTCDGQVAERFESKKAARDFLKRDEDAREWLENHSNVRVVKIKIGYIVYPPKGAITA